MTSEPIDPAETPEPTPQKRRRGRWLWWLLLLIIAVFVACFCWLVLSERVLHAPDWLRDRVETQLNMALTEDDLGTDGGIEFGDISVQVANYVPQVVLSNVTLKNPRTGEVARFDAMSTTLDPASALRGSLLPETVHLERPVLSLLREGTGRLNLQFGAEDTQTLTPEDGAVALQSPGDFIALLQESFGLPVLAKLSEVRADDLSIHFVDERSGADWRLTDGRFVLRQDDAEIEMQLDVRMSDEAATARVSVATQKGKKTAQMAVDVDKVAGADMATQIPALAILSVVDAPVSGSLRSQIGDDGNLGALNGALQIGAGYLRPKVDVDPVPIETATLYFGYDRDAQAVTFDQIEVKTDLTEASGRGVAYLQDFTNNWPRATVGQFRFDHLVLSQPDLFDTPVSYDNGGLDFRFELNPFKVTIGQLILGRDAGAVTLSGDLQATDGGWSAAVDVAAKSMDVTEVLAIWPRRMIKGTREWIANNVHEGTFSDFNAAVRMTNDAAPVVGLSFGFDQANVTVMPTLPPIDTGAGYASILNDELHLTLTNGFLSASDQEPLDLAGSVFHLPDVKQLPAQANVTLEVEGDFGATLAMIDRKPFEFLSKGGLSTELAEGQVDITTRLSLPLKKKITFADVTYSVQGVASDVSSDTLVADHALRSDLLEVIVDREGIEIEGGVDIAGVPAYGRWQQNFGPEFAGQSQITGTVELSQRSNQRLGFGLPDTMLRGAATGRVTLDLVRGRVPAFDMTSDLDGLGITLGPVGWRKGVNSKGDLRVQGTLATPPTIDRLAITTGGLSGTGRVEISPVGDLEIAQFDTLKIGNWFNGSAALLGRGAGRLPLVRVNKGTLDMRRAPFGGDSGGGSGTSGGAIGPMEIRLDRLRISEGISLTGFNATFAAGRDVNANFTASVNGKSPIKGTLSPSTYGTKVDITANDAGGVIDAAGIIDKANGGTLALNLTPRQKTGNYDGFMTAENIRVTGASALTELLSAISVIGLLEQLDGEGLAFSDVQANFVLTPDIVAVTQSSAVGASLGVSLDGTYDLATSTMRFQGVISPIYFVNGIGRIFTRRGEGLLGFNFQLLGSNDAPQVKVNPLSIFTPGMFREIFRRAPPSVPE